MTTVMVNLLSFTGFKGGMETYTRELYREIGKLGAPYTFVGYGSTEFMKLDHSWFPGEVVSSGLSGENRFVWAFGELIAVGRKAEKLGADLIHSPATLGTMRSKVPSVLTIHDLLYYKNPELMNVGYYTKPVQWMEKQAAGHAKRILATSNTLANDIATILGVDRDSIDVVPLAGTKAKIDGPPRERQSDLLFSAGNRRKHKNFDGLLTAMTLIPEDRRPRLVITGSHGDDPLKPIVAELGLGAWVELKGWISQEELDTLYATATAFIMPSFVDGFALPPLEAMIVGCPVMVSGNEMMREVGGDVAEYFDPYDPQSIADTIVDTLADPALLASMSERGIGYASQFSWKKVAEGTLESFARTLEQSGSSRRG